jgi:hypothetical protein
MEHESSAIYYLHLRRPIDAAVSQEQPSFSFGVEVGSSGFFLIGSFRLKYCTVLQRKQQNLKNISL